MKILSIEATSASHKLPKEFYGSNYTYTHKKCVFANATTDVGISSFVYLGDDFGLGREIAKAVNEKFSKVIVNRDLLEVEFFWNDMRPLVRDILGDRRVALHAQALLDILCWDLLAKKQSCSVVKLLGKKRQSVPTMAIAGYYTQQNSLAELADETRALITLGCRGIKLKVGGLSIDEDIARAQTVRDAGGKDFHLAVDANQAWSLKEATRFSELSEPLNIYWIEEPVHWDNDIVDLATLRKRTSIPICAGQSENSVSGIARLIDADAVDICNLHPGYSGGITPWLEAAELARKAGLKVANTGEPQLSASLMLAMEHAMPVEIYHPDRDPLFPKYCPAFSARINGNIKAGNLPGWGIVQTSSD